MLDKILHISVCYNRLCKKWLSFICSEWSLPDLECVSSTKEVSRFPWFCEVAGNFIFHQKEFESSSIPSAHTQHCLGQKMSSYQENIYTFPRGQVRKTDV